MSKPTTGHLVPPAHEPHARACPPARVPDPSQAASAVEAAALLVSQAIQDSRQPVTDLGSALQRMSEAALAQEGLTREMAVCIESLQFHDRLVQQLAFARDLLVSVLSQKEPDMASYGATRWNAALAAVRCSHGTDKHRGLSGLPSVAAPVSQWTAKAFIRR